MASSQVLAQDAVAQRIKELEERLRAMQSGMQTMQNELESLKIQSSQVTGKVEKIQQNPQNQQTPQPTEKVGKVSQTASSAETNQEDQKKSNMVFFRGGFAHSSQHRDGMVFHSDVVSAGAQDRPDKNGWYFGAGFDWNLTKNAWDLAPRTNVLAELMFEYKEFSSHVQGNALANMPTQLIGGAINPHSVTVSQLSIYASPKIKFLEGNRFRPWIIPAGFGMHIISPPGESASFFIPGVVFAGGAEYRVWKDFYAGVDARYHITGGKKDGINVDGLTAGGYLGIGF
ncbi:porin family protein [Nitrosomonas sp. Is24]|uniref:porin family protein n=1 Tax=Nitrosomonas sp. Is24 TaxID=3080533 RepID=UPI00294B50B6|nr:porin family protein [Nitrosomonas sp. Is24]MDV6341191.1 porin family protein [Nitrosomonas sp. Is24]